MHPIVPAAVDTLWKRCGSAAARECSADQEVFVPTMRVQPLPPTLRPFGRDTLLTSDARLLGARVTGMLGLGAYNWWLATPFVPGMLRSPNGFFSDLSADGQPHAAMLHRVDTLGGMLLLVALLLRGSSGGSTKRPEWAWLVAFAIISAVGGMFPYACSPGLDAACRRLQFDFDLPVHHYVHMVAGVLEFFTATMAIWLARRSDPEGHTLPGRAGHFLLPVVLVAYPLLGYSYFFDQVGSLVEPAFFIVFSAMVAAELSAHGAEVQAGPAESTAMRDGGPPAELGLP